MSACTPAQASKACRSEATAEAFGASRVFVIGDNARRIELTVGADGRFAAVANP